jgi:hypothetical protein
MRLRFGAHERDRRVAGRPDEIVEDEPGQAAVLDRLLDLLLVAVLRVWSRASLSGACGAPARVSTAWPALAK